MELALRFAHIWWAGFKVICRWAAFSIVLQVVGLPLAGLAYLTSGYADSILIVVIILLTPIPFYLTSKYLLLLGDRDQDAEEAAERPAGVDGRGGYGLRMKIIISTAVAFLSGFVVTPSPDPFSALVFGIPAAFLCGVSLLILSGFSFMKSSSKSVQTLVCVLVCIVSVLSVACLLLSCRESPVYATGLPVYFRTRRLSILRSREARRGIRPAGSINPFHRSSHS